MGRWWSYELEPDEDDYEDFAGDEHWEDDVPDHWWADFPDDAADVHFTSAAISANVEMPRDAEIDTARPT